MNPAKNIHRTGEKITMPTARVKTVTTIFRYGFFLRRYLILRIFTNHAHQENGNDIHGNNSRNTAGEIMNRAVMREWSVAINCKPFRL